MNKSDFKALKDTKESKLTTYLRCMKDNEVKWFDRTGNKSATIPSHYIAVMQNDKAKKLFNVKNFDKLVEKYWK